MSSVESLLYHSALTLLGLDGYAGLPEGYMIDLCEKGALDDTPAFHKAKKLEISLAAELLRSLVALEDHQKKKADFSHQEIYLAILEWLKDQEETCSLGPPGQREVWVPSAPGSSFWIPSLSLTKAMETRCYPTLMLPSTLDSVWHLLEEEGVLLSVHDLFETLDGKTVQVEGPSIFAVDPPSSLGPCHHDPSHRGLYRHITCRQHWPLFSSELCFYLDPKVKPVEVYEDPWSRFFEERLAPEAHQALMVWVAAALHCPTKRPTYLHDNLLIVLIIDDRSNGLVGAWVSLLELLNGPNGQDEGSMIYRSIHPPKARALHWEWSSAIPPGAITWETRTHLLLQEQGETLGEVDLPLINEIGPWLRRAVTSLNSFSSHPFSSPACRVLRYPKILPLPIDGKVSYWAAWEEIVLSSYKWYPVMPLPPKLNLQDREILRKAMATCLTGRDVHELIEDWATRMEVTISRRSPKVNPKIALSTFQKYFGKGAALSILSSTFDGQWAIGGVASSLAPTKSRR